MKYRLKALRKALDLTQRDFASRIGMKPNTIATYEIGRAFPSDPAINNICKEFHVNEEWLRTGTGEMFLPPPRDVLDELVEQHGLPREFRSLVDKFIDLRPDQQEAVIEYVRKVAADLMANDPAADPVGDPPWTEEQHTAWEAEADEFAAMAREQFLSEKLRESKASSARGSGGPGGVA